MAAIASQRPQQCRQLHFGGVGGFWTSLALMAVLCFSFRELASMHYGIAVVCLTDVVVILLSFCGIPAADSVLARGIGTALGSALALLAYLLWPTRERGRERATPATASWRPSTVCCVYWRSQAT